MQDIREPINERSTRALTIPFLDQSGQALVDGVVSSLTVTLRDVTSGTLIRENQSVLNVNGGTLSGGVLTLVLTPTDTQIFGAGGQESRLLTVDLLTSGNVRITEEIHFLVKNLQDITTPVP